MMDATPSLILLLVMAVVAVLFIGGLVLGVVLIIGERTRVAGIALLVLLLLGVPLVGMGLGAYLWVGLSRPAPVRQMRVPQIRVPEPLRPPADFAPPPMPQTPEAVPMDGPTDGDLHEHPGQTEADQPSPAEEPQSDTADEQPDTNSQSGRPPAHGTHRHMNT